MLTPEVHSESYFEQLKGRFPRRYDLCCTNSPTGEVLSVLANETNYHETIQNLERELSVYKRAYSDIDAERKQFDKLRQDAERQRDELESQLKARSFC